MDEHRRKARHRLDMSIKVVEAGSGTDLGRVFDINSEGFMLLSPQALEGNETYRLMFLVPQVAERYEANICLQAVCLWSQGSSYSTEFGAGFRLGEISESDGAALQNFMQHFNSYKRAQI